MSLNAISHLGTGAGSVQVHRDRGQGQVDVLLRYVPVGSVGVGTQIRGLRRFRLINGALQEIPADPPTAIVGPPSTTGIWNLNTGGTLDISNGAGQPLGVGYFLCLGEISQAEAEAILGGPLPA